jgi:hypothetical protein
VTRPKPAGRRELEEPNLVETRLGRPEGQPPLPRYVRSSGESFRHYRRRGGTTNLQALKVAGFEPAQPRPVLPARWHPRARSAHSNPEYEEADWCFIGYGASRHLLAGDTVPGRDLKCATSVARRCGAGTATLGSSASGRCAGNHDVRARLGASDSPGERLSLARAAFRRATRWALRQRPPICPESQQEAETRSLRG